VTKETQIHNTPIMTQHFSNTLKTINQTCKNATEVKKRNRST